MEALSLRELAVPIIKAIDSFNFLLKSHHRRVAVISYHIGKELGLDNHQLFELVIAASLHDIGALSVQERDMLVQEDVENPDPHCIMGQEMLSTFAPFEQIAHIIRYHHVNYLSSHTDSNIPLNSYIIHLADRVDIYTSADEFILDQRDEITSRIIQKSGAVFHPKVTTAFESAAKSDAFWFNINNWSIELLFKKLEVTKDLEITIDILIDFALLLSKVIDYRSHYTSSHSYTVAHLAYLIGGYFNFSQEKCQKLLIAGYLHDIGKLAIDPGLLEKEGPLNEAEFNIMKMHVYYTGLILSELSISDWFSEIVMWAERHHEKANGQGYPYAVSDDSLDIGVKILAYADIISALMENRPYRESLSIEQSFDIIRAKIAHTLSPEIFCEIEQHRDEINALVIACHQHSFDEYNSVQHQIALSGSV